MSRAFGKLWMPLSLVGLSAWIALSTSSMGDYPMDAAPAVRALGHGDLSAYFDWKTLRGPFASIVQAPFALFGTSPLGEYRWASFPCLLVAAAVGLYLGRIARRRGAGIPTQVLVPFLCVVNPLTFVALPAGHAEEILTAALAVGAVALATEGHDGRAAILLGLAIASKQWAVMAIFPTLMALPARRVRCGSLAILLALVLMLPEMVIAPATFFGTQGVAAAGGTFATIWSGWYPATSEVVLHLGGNLTGRIHRMPGWLGPMTHQLIVLCMIALPLALWLRRGQFRLPGEQAMALLALLALLRCVLDPLDNLYYHVPLFFALLGWDALSGDRLPLRSLLCAAFALLFWKWSNNLGSLEAFNAAYILVAGTAAIAIAVALVRRAPARARPAPMVATAARA